ncbi:MAG: deoxyribose-phosphate aldolase [Fusobacteriaceae bacterium]|nr:deoxyribose-phosphate aldolase [Fusobacteriaceae bacterium]
MELNRFIDHTLLKAVTTVDEIKNLCMEAKKYNFHSICVNSTHVPLAKTELEGTNVKIAVVVGFPLGAMSEESKIYEAQNAIKNGADEIDMVINIGYVKSGLMKTVEDEITNIKKAIGDKVLKVIFENCYLTDEEKVQVAEACIRAKADYLKTSTGFGTGGSTFEDVLLMKKTVGNNCKIKASGGIKDRETAKKYIDLGVSRLGTSSGVELITTGIAKKGEY